MRHGSNQVLVQKEHLQENTLGSITWIILKGGSSFFLLENRHFLCSVVWQPSVIECLNHCLRSFIDNAPIWLYYQTFAAHNLQCKDGDSWMLGMNLEVWKHWWSTMWRNNRGISIFRLLKNIIMNQLFVPSYNDGQKSHLDLAVKEPVHKKTNSAQHFLDLICKGFCLIIFAFWHGLWCDSIYL